jgi:SAM-dependent methyltransferase
MDKGYYREYFDIERNHWWFRGRREILSKYVARHIAAGRHLSILNAGVATGATSEMLTDFGKVTSLEYEQECIDFIRDKVAIEVDQGSITDLPYSNQAFDLVCAFDVVEHVEDDQRAVDEMIRVCKKGGSILITVPAFQSLWSEHDVINHHFRRYRLSQLTELFRKDQGEVVYASYFNFFLFLPIWLARLGSKLVAKRNSPQSDFQKFKTGPASSLLYYVLKSESLALNKQTVLPWGVSVLLHFRKHD